MVDRVMETYMRYKNRLEMFLSSDKGRRVLNFLYSWGASIVILGAMFKLLHLPYANQILFIAMVMESIVFFISGFERPGKDYHWEEVFPGLTSAKPKGVPDIAARLDISEEDRKNLAGSVKKLSNAVEQISRIAEQLSGMSRNMEDINWHSREYAEHIERLNHNISGLNAVYENQLKSINTQFDAIRHINAGLSRIREMYEGSVADSALFRSETDKMARQLAELNQVYSRLLQAMTVHVGYQQPADQQPYDYQSPAPYFNNHLE